jgi:5'-methylthioadenosine phosphorylase
MELPRVTGTRLGLIVGSALELDALPELAIDGRITTDTIETDRGRVRVHDLGHALVVYRHHAAGDDYCPAHRIDHHRTMAAMCAAGCDRVLALASVGSLRGWPVGTVVAPFDFFAPGLNPTFFDDERGHSIPGFHAPWRDRVLEAWDHATATTVMDGGVYAQTAGPRFETPAEVRMLAAHADIVGMTVASECILAGEAGLAYAAVCTVDNLGNGLGATQLTTAEFHEGVAANKSRLLADVRAVLPRLAAEPVGGISPG